MLSKAALAHRISLVINFCGLEKTLVQHHLHTFLPQTVCPHWRVLTVSVKAAVWSGCSICSPAFFPQILDWNHSCDMSICVSASHKLCVAILVPGFFPVNSRSKCLLWHVHVRFDRRLAQTVRRDLGPWFFPVYYSRSTCVLWHVHVHFDCAGSHKRGVAILGPGIFLENSRLKWLFWLVQVHFDCAGSHKVCAAGFWSSSSHYGIFIA